MTTTNLQGKVLRIGLAAVMPDGDVGTFCYALVLEGRGRLQFRVSEQAVRKFGPALALTQPGDYVHLSLGSGRRNSQVLHAFSNTVLGDVPLSGCGA